MSLESLRLFFKMNPIKDDLERATQEMGFIEGNHQYNFRVTDPYYLDPAVSEEILPINHDHGLFMYFREIIKVLELDVKQ